MKEQRRQEIETYVSQMGRISMKELQYKFKVSMNTLRADIDFLSKSGNISKVYGGVEYVMKHRSFDNRRTLQRKEKMHIAQKAASLVEDSDVIYLDYGTTTAGIVDFLDARKDVTIITANLYVIQKCLDHPNLFLTVLPGEFSQGIFGLLSENTNTDLKNFSIGKAFMSCCGILEDGRVCVSRFLQQKIKQNVILQSKERYLLTDSSKFHEVRMLNYSVLSDFNALITDDEMDEESKLLCQSCNIQTLLV